MIKRYHHFNDIDRVMVVAKRMHEESRYSRIPFEPSTVRDFLHQAYNGRSRNLMLISEIGGKMCGFFMGVIVPYYFSSRIYAADMAWYMVPEHRGHPDSIKMLKMFEKWAVESGVTEIQLGLGTEITTDQTRELYRKLGYEEKYFLHAKYVE